MSARDLYAAGITSPEMLAHCIGHATSKAHTPRITASMRRRDRKAWRTVWIVVACVGVVAWRSVA